MIKKRVLIGCILIFAVVFFAGCSRDQEVVSSVEEQSVDQRIIDMVQKATDDPVLQKEMQEELQFLVKYNYVQIDDVVIEFHTGPDDITEVDYQGIKNEFIYVHGGVMKDMMIRRDQVRTYMREHKGKSLCFTKIS
jgi:hypothetical protein